MSFFVKTVFGYCFAFDGSALPYPGLLVSQNDPVMGRMRPCWLKFGKVNPTVGSQGGRDSFSLITACHHVSCSLPVVTHSYSLEDLPYFYRNQKGNKIMLGLMCKSFWVLF